MKSSNKKKKNWGINRKALLSIIVFTLLMNVIMCISGSLIFDKAIQKIYNERGYVVANIIMDEIDHDKIAEYTSTWQADDYYYEMVDYLKGIQAHSNAAYIYIGVPYEDKTIKYVYDSGSNIGFVDPIAAPFDEIWQAYQDGVQPKSYLVRHSQYGYLTSSCLPIKDSSGKVVALLFVDTNMEVIRTTLNRFALNISIISFIVLGIYCIISWRAMRTSIIKPLMIIKNNLRLFSIDTSYKDDALENINTNDELEELAKSVSNMEKDIVEYIDDIKRITAEKERIGVELNIASRIQESMLPNVFPPFPGRNEFEIFATMTPAKEVGGDFYDFFFIDDNHLALVMADVSGKGVPAAIFMAIAKVVIKIWAINGNNKSPSQILEDVNNLLCKENETGLFVTVWLAFVELSTGKVISANAGHEHPAIKRKDGKFELDIYKHSPAVATIEGIKYREHEFKLNPGDTVFVYTDGVAEATNASNELFGTTRMLEALNAVPNAEPKKLLSNVKQAIDGFVGAAPQFDDITMLGFTYKGVKDD